MGAGMAMRIVESGSVTFKAVLIGVIVLLLLIPLAMLEACVTERAGLREQAYQRVAEGWGGELTVGGPMLIVPTERKAVIDGQETVTARDVYLMPAKLDADVEVKLDPQPRYVGYTQCRCTCRHCACRASSISRPCARQLEQTGVTYLVAEPAALADLIRCGSLREIQQATFAGQPVKLGPGDARRPHGHRGARGFESAATVARRRVRLRHRGRRQSRGVDPAARWRRPR